HRRRGHRRAAKNRWRLRQPPPRHRHHPVGISWNAGIVVQPLLEVRLLLWGHDTSCPPFARVALGFPPVYGGPDDLCRAARHLSLFVVVAGLKTGSLDSLFPPPSRYRMEQPFGTR